jgi:hypothetical protein
VIIVFPGQFDERREMNGDNRTPVCDLQGDFPPAGATVHAISLTADRILADPLFPSARAAFVDELLSIYEGNPFLTRLLTEAGRGVVFFNLLTLNACYDPRDRETWPTTKLLKHTVSRFGVTGERRIHDILRRLVETGYAESASSPIDGRVRLLTATAKMRQHHRDWLRAFYVPLEILRPDPGYPLAIDRDEAFQVAQLRVGRQWEAYAAELMLRNPVIMFFMSRVAGMVILMKLIQLEHRGVRTKPSRLYAHFAEKFGVSRTHVNILIGEAAANDFLRSSEEGFLVLPVAASAFDRFLADSLVGNDGMYRAATSLASIDFRRTGSNSAA